MDVEKYILDNVNNNQLSWILECPKCGAMVNAKYAIELTNTKKENIIQYYYCPCNRYQIMELCPAKIMSYQTIILIYVFIKKLCRNMTKYVFNCSINNSK